MRIGISLIRIPKYDVYIPWVKLLILRKENDLNVNFVAFKVQVKSSFFEKELGSQIAIVDIHPNRNLMRQRGIHIGDKCRRTTTSFSVSTQLYPNPIKRKISQK